MRFEFATATRIIFGAGAVRDVGRMAKQFGQRALIVSGRDLSRAQPLGAVLREQGLETTGFSVAGEPEIATVQRGVALARQVRCDVVVGFGGGSARDGGKAIGAMLSDEGEWGEYVVGRGHR